MACWNFPTVYQAPFSLGNIDIKGAAQDVLNKADKAIERAFDLDWPENLTADFVQGSARPTLIEASRDATLPVLGRREFGGFKGQLMGPSAQPAQRTRIARWLLCTQLLHQHSGLHC